MSHFPYSVTGEPPVPGYKLVRHSEDQPYIGRGGFGEVWKVLHIGSCTHYAMKFIRLDRQAAKMVRGICNARHLQHPYLLPVFGMWYRTQNRQTISLNETTIPKQFSDEAVEIVLKLRLCDGSLMDELDRQPNGLDPGLLLKYMEQVAEVLDYLNKPDGDRPAVRHGDVKPSNILLFKRQVQVCDYDLAGHLVSDVLTSTMRKIYTPHYVAPEHFDAGDTDTSDLYSLGMTYFQLRCGKLPFDTHNQTEVILSVINHQFDMERLSSNPAEREVVAKAIARDPRERYPDCRSFVEALRAVLFPNRATPEVGALETVKSPPAVEFADLLRPGACLVPGYHLRRPVPIGNRSTSEYWEALGPNERTYLVELVGRVPDDLESIRGGLKSWFHSGTFLEGAMIVRGPTPNTHAVLNWGEASSADERAAIGVAAVRSVQLASLVRAGERIVPNYALIRPCGEGEFGGTAWEATTDHGHTARLEVVPVAEPEFVDAITGSARQSERTFWVIDVQGNSHETPLVSPFAVAVVILHPLALTELLRPRRAIVPGHILQERSAIQPGRLGGDVWHAQVDGRNGATAELEILSDGRRRLADLWDHVRDAKAKRWIVWNDGRVVDWDQFAPPIVRSMRAIVLKWKLAPMDRVQAEVEIVPGYRLRRELEFGTDVLWKAYGPGNWPCALRIAAIDPDGDLAELRTLRLWQKLSHPHLLELKQSWLLDEYGVPMRPEQQPLPERPMLLICATECPIESLDDSLRQVQSRGEVGLPFGTLLEYMRQTADALDHLHENRTDFGGDMVAVVHQRIRPESLLLTAKDTVVVSDFGLSRLMEVGRSRVTVGPGVEWNSPYVAPEVLNDRRALPASDQYSLAITYYRLRTGSLPVTQAPPWKIGSRAATGRLDLSGLKHAAERAVVAKALAAEPHDRYANCSLFVSELARVGHVPLRGGGAANG